MDVLSLVMEAALLAKRYLHGPESLSTFNDYITSIPSLTS